MRSRVLKTTALVIAITILLVPMAASMSTVSEIPTVTSDGWNITGKFYKYFVPDVSSNAKFYQKTSDGYLAMTSDSVNDTSMGAEKWFPVTVTSADQKSFIGDGLSVRFRANDGMVFGDVNQCNGYISFAWTAARITSVPTSLYSQRYSGIAEPGGLAYDQRPGVYVTLFPSQSGQDSGTHRVRTCQIAVRGFDGTVSVLQRKELNSAIDISNDTTVSINKTSVSEYGVYLNGVYISSIQAEDVPEFTGGGYLTLAASCAAIFAANNLTIKEMNGYSAVSYGAAYEAQKLMEKVPAPGYVIKGSADVISAVQEAKTAYNALNSTEKTQVNQRLKDNLTSAMAYLGI